MSASDEEVSGPDEAEKVEEEIEKVKKKSKERKPPSYSAFLQIHLISFISTVNSNAPRILICIFSVSGGAEGSTLDQRNHRSAAVVTVQNRKRTCTCLCKSGPTGQVTPSFALSPHLTTPSLTPSFDPSSEIWTTYLHSAVIFICVMLTYPTIASLTFLLWHL